MDRQYSKRARRRPAERVLVECDVAAGVELIAADEVRERLPRAGPVVVEQGTLLFDARPDDLTDVTKLRTVAGGWLVVGYEGARPSVVLGDSRLAQTVTRVVGLHASGTVRGLHFSAAGAGSSVMRRVRAVVSSSAGLPEDPEGLVVRIRRSRRPGVGWEVLVALAPRSLAARDWRVRHTPGALNGPLAAALVRLTAPATTDRFLNFACGSATLAIERVFAEPSRLTVACDISARALNDADANVTAAGLRGQISLVRADARRLPFTGRAFDVLSADLPWGRRVGSHDQNVADYRDLLLEAGRVARRRARMCVLTAELRLTQRVVGALADLWRVDRVLRVDQGGATPSVFVLRRS